MDPYIYYISKEAGIIEKDAKIRVSPSRMFNRIFGYSTPYGIKTKIRYGPRIRNMAGIVGLQEGRIYKGIKPNLVFDQTPTNITRAN